ncbi:hypothetical protein [Streptomyces bacillaris]|uniref:hypothetical protein n=1 Tax=Streptomyces bacillaris TaxID=68179 RepID=UPI00345F2C7D
MQVQQGVSRTLAILGKCHEDLTEFSSRLLREEGFGSNVELVHQILFEPIDATVGFTSLHRFTVSIGPDFEDCREIEISARLLIGESPCTAAVDIRADTENPLEEADGKKIVLHEEAIDGIDLAAATDFLKKAVRGLGDLIDPLVGRSQ